MKALMQVTNTAGVTFNVRLVYVGDKYGLDNCQTHTGWEPKIEFYVTRFDFTALGQFVTRYTLSTFLEGDSGVDLDGSVDAWFITARNKRDIAFNVDMDLPVAVKKVYSNIKKNAFDFAAAISGQCK